MHPSPTQEACLYFSSEIIKLVCVCGRCAYPREPSQALCNGTRSLDQAPHRLAAVASSAFAADALQRGESARRVGIGLREQPTAAARVACCNERAEGRVQPGSGVVLVRGNDSDRGLGLRPCRRISSVMTSLMKCT